MGVKPVEYHEGAAADVRNAVAWYRERSRAAAVDFVQELQRAVDTIVAAPERWPAGKHNTRRFLLWRFPFAVIYSELESTIVIWAVAHGSRHPEYWRDRL